MLRIQHARLALAGTADDLQGLAFVAAFELAARLDRPATALFEVGERVDVGMRPLVGVGGAGLRALSAARPLQRVREARSDVEGLAMALLVASAEPLEGAVGRVARAAERLRPGRSWTGP